MKTFVQAIVFLNFNPTFTPQKVQIAIEPFAMFYSHPTVFMIICVSLRCFTDEVEDPCADRTYTVEPRYLELAYFELPLISK